MNKQEQKNQRFLSPDLWLYWRRVIMDIKKSNPFIYIKKHLSFDFIIFKICWPLKPG